MLVVVIGLISNSFCYERKLWESMNMNNSHLVPNRNPQRKKNNLIRFTESCINTVSNCITRGAEPSTDLTIFNLDRNYSDSI